MIGILFPNRCRRGTYEPYCLHDRQRRLSEIGSEEAFYDALRAALIAQRSEEEYYLVIEEAPPPQAPTVDAQTPPPVALPDSGGSGVGGSSDSAVTAPATGSGESGGLDVTSTNVQEIGVDEADRVKTDGEHLYVLSQPQYYYGPGPIPVDAPPEPVPITITVGDTLEADNRLSMPAPPLDASSDLRILRLRPDVPDALPISEITLDFNGLSADGMYLHKNDSSSSLVVTASGLPGYQDWYDPYAFDGAKSLLTKIDVTMPSAARLTESVKLDGEIISSRRIGKQMFFASRHYPAIPGVNPYSVDLETWINIVNSTDLSKVLPRYTMDAGQNSTSLVNPAECFVSPLPDDAYYTPDIISLVTVDIDTMQVSDTACYLGSSETLYASPDSVYLATTVWNHGNGLEDSVVSTSPAPDQAIYDPRTDTDIHKFSIGDGTLDYQGTGTVVGHLGWNNLRKPFRMSEYNGNLRVITHSASQDSSVSPVYVTVLQPNNEGDLIRVGQLPNQNHPGHIGKPWEDLYATRFLGDTAYLVTFRQTDPLYVIDLAKPTDLSVAGELEIEGYSDYLHPIADGFLLGIGKDAIASGTGDGALTLGVKLSLFDVSDPKNPSEVQSVTVGQRGTESAALSDHRGITVQPANDLHPTRVAIGVDIAGSVDGPRPPNAQSAAWYEYSYTGLHGFEVRTGDDAGIALVGVLKTQPNADYLYYGNGYADRSVLVNDATYYINESDVYSADWNDLSNAIGPR